jgi:hypothetical protein
VLKAQVGSKELIIKKEYLPASQGEAFAKVYKILMEIALDKRIGRVVN